MTPEKHAELLARQSYEETITKYVKGQLEHKTFLWEEPMGKVINHALEEMIDGGVYLRTIRAQMVDLRRAFTELTDLITEGHPSADVLSLIQEIQLLLGL